MLAVFEGKMEINRERAFVRSNLALKANSLVLKAEKCIQFEEKSKVFAGSFSFPCSIRNLMDDHT
jgi:hypothetical protein